jgi:hypothetical protein
MENYKDDDKCSACGYSYGEHASVDKNCPIYSYRRVGLLGFAITKFCKVQSDENKKDLIGRVSAEFIEAVKEYLAARSTWVHNGGDETIKEEVRAWKKMESVFNQMEGGA